MFDNEKLAALLEHEPGDKAGEAFDAAFRRDDDAGFYRPLGCLRAAVGCALMDGHEGTAALKAALLDMAQRFDRYVAAKTAEGRARAAERQLQGS